VAKVYADDAGTVTKVDIEINTPEDGKKKAKKKVKPRFLRDVSKEKIQKQSSSFGDEGWMKIEEGQIEEGELVSVEEEVQPSIVAMPKFLSSVYKHGQYPNATVGGTFKQANVNSAGVDKLEDDHHSPLTADGYLKLRVRPQLRFYQSRLPRYSRMRGSFETFLLLGSLTGTLLAFMNMSQWAAVPAALTAMITGMYV
jgi:hypothetical protein